MTVAWYNSRSPGRADWTQRRKTQRRKVWFAATILAETDRAVICGCTVADVSQGGARLLIAESASVPGSFLLVLAQGGSAYRKCTVRWRSPTALGVEFERDASRGSSRLS
jgi:hypothetical protein